MKMFPLLAVKGYMPKNEEPLLTRMPGQKWLETSIYAGSTSFFRLLLHQLLLLSLPVFLFFCIALVVLQKKRKTGSESSSN